MTINQIQDDIIEEFSCLDDWMDRYGLLIDMGNELPELSAEEKIEDNLIEGCQSRVWIAPHEEDDGTLTFHGGSDAVIVKGMVALLLRIFNGHTAQEILDAKLYFVDKIGLREHLSPNRSNGLIAMIDRIKGYALSTFAR